MIEIKLGDARHLDIALDPESVALSVWSPPYHVGKEYERDQSFIEWKSLLRRTLASHSVVLKKGGFVAINIADILCFEDDNLPRIMAENVTSRRRADITRDAILEVQSQHPGWGRQQIAKELGCSEQTVDRRLRGNNIRGGKYAIQTRVLLAGPLLEQAALEVGLVLYDRRIWQKDPAWVNSRWHTMSYRAVDEFEYVYIFWKPGPTIVNKSRLSRDEWVEWGSRGVWHIPSVRSNDDHVAKFPIELPRRLIRLLSEAGDLVIDPFVGSGTTALAALSEGRDFIGIDKEAKYVTMARNAVSQYLIRHVS